MRTGPPTFTESFTAELTPSRGSFFTDPLLLHDFRQAIAVEVVEEQWIGEKGAA